MKTNQTGFTLVELVVVMVILGVLAATAMPKFMNVTTQAHQAAVAGTGGSFGSAVHMVRATWVAGANTGAVTNMAGYGTGTPVIDTNATGWAIATDGGLNASSDCVDLWGALMQNPPSVSTATGSDYRAILAGSTCTFTYQGDTANTRSIAYDTSAGTVTLTNP